MDFKVLAVGDICGESGLNWLCRSLREIKRKNGIDFCVVNGENAAIVGITKKQAEAMFDAGADVITLGNHSFNRREIAPYLDDCPYILRHVFKSRPEAQESDYIVPVLRLDIGKGAYFHITESSVADKALRSEHAGDRYAVFYANV